MRLLIIDDSRAARAILKSICKRFATELLEAADGKAALELLQRAAPIDLALVDWNMPVMDGLEFVKAVRCDRRFDSMLLMMVTAETEMQRVAAALEAGANEFVMKPFTADVIAEKLAILGLAVGETP